ncbi:hypothetical protein HDV06_000121 [Boothiomyces sp. JEL0866]|nr:hypothetical protein HDV06_000121 [Boothiomyces sp. JEL0866]
MTVEILNQVPEFVDLLITRLGELNISVDRLFMDHVCYRVETEQEYLDVYVVLKQKGKILVEEMVGGRPIATFKLDQPIEISKYGRKVDVIELPMPKENSFYASGWEHAEFVTETPLEEFAKKYNVKWDFSGLKKKFNADIRVDLSTLSKRLNVKFHNLPLEKVIEIEQSNKPL